MAERINSSRPGILYGLYSARLRRQLADAPRPHHVAMIIDGNRRWARERALETAAHGHRAGAEKMREFLGWCNALGIRVVTIYLLSADNLMGRSEEGLEQLFVIIGDLATDLAALGEGNGDWRIQHVGTTDGLPVELVDRLREAQRVTTGRTGLHVNLAVGYGGRREIADAMRSIVRSHGKGGGTIDDLAEILTPELIAENLYTQGQPDPDLILRTSGEQRLSDFMLWQSAHSEFYFVDALGPDLREVDFLRELCVTMRRGIVATGNDGGMALTPLSVDDYAARFDEEPGYLDFARVGPIGSTVQEELRAQYSALARARFGSLDAVMEQGDRVGAAVAALTGFRPDQIVFQPNTSQGLMHVMFGITGGVAISPAEFPSLTFAAVRAAQSLGVLTPKWLETDHGRVTPGNLREQLSSSVVALGLSLVDFRTGYLADLEGIRQVIGDRLLIVDASQCFGVVDAPWHLADAVVAGGQKWPRAGWGTGFLALSDRAREHLTPVWSGFSGTDVVGTPMDEVPDPTSTAAAFQVTNPDPMAQARLAASLEEIAAVGVSAINARIAERVSRIIDLADEFAIPVVSPRAEAERAGIVVLEPAPDQLTVLAASLHNHGVSATTRQDKVRLSAHVSTEEETFTMLRSAFVSFGTATSV